MKIIDIHAHVFPDPIASKASKSIGEFYGLNMDEGGTVGRLLELEREAGIGHSCIHSVAVTPHSIDSINRFISKSAAEHADCLTGYGSIHPGRENIPELVEEVRYRIRVDHKHWYQLEYLLDGNDTVYAIDWKYIP